MGLGCRWVGFRRGDGIYKASRQQEIARPSSSSSSTFEVRNPSSSFGASLNDIDTSSSLTSSCLAAKAIRASSARRESSFSSLDNASPVSQPTSTTTTTTPASLPSKFQNTNHLEESNLERNSPKFLKGMDTSTSFLTHIGGTIGKPLEEGFTIVENWTLDIIQETRKHIRKKPGDSVGQSQETNHSTKQQAQLRTQMPPMQTDQELQLKASHNVRLQWQWLPKQSTSSGVENCQS